MPKGTCGLCRQATDLRDSHLLPKAVYKTLRKAAEADGQKNVNPILVTSSVALKTSDQVSDYFLCSDCEGRFSAKGEKWMIENCWRNDSSFPLRESLQATTPSYTGSSGLSMFDSTAVPGLDAKQLIYFAASVFWRAAAHKFGPVLGVEPSKLEFGPYEEQLRTFLLDHATFPANAALVVTVNSETAAGANELALFPWLRDGKSGCHQYAFTIPGVTFQLFLGNSITAELHQLSAAGPRHIVVLAPHDGTVMDMGKLIAQAEPKGDLKL